MSRISILPYSKTDTSLRSVRFTPCYWFAAIGKAVWVAQVFIDEKMPGLKTEIGFDPEASMFCAYSKNAEALQKFAVGFCEMCDHDELMTDLFSRAELD